MHVRQIVELKKALVRTKNIKCKRL